MTEMDKSVYRSNCPSVEMLKTSSSYLLFIDLLVMLTLTVCNHINILSMASKFNYDWIIGVCLNTIG